MEKTTIINNNYGQWIPIRKLSSAVMESDTFPTWAFPHAAEATWPTREDDSLGPSNITHELKRTEPREATTGDCTIMVARPQYFH